MTIRTSNVVRQHPGSYTAAREHRDPDTAHAVAWMLDHFPTGAMLVLVNQWEITPARAARDVFHSASPGYTVRAALLAHYSPPNPRPPGKESHIRELFQPAQESSHDNCFRDSELLDWIAI